MSVVALTDFLLYTFEVHLIARDCLVLTKRFEGSLVSLTHCMLAAVAAPVVYTDHLFSIYMERTQLCQAKTVVRSG